MIIDIVIMVEYGTVFRIFYVFQAPLLLSLVDLVNYWAIFWFLAATAAQEAHLSMGGWVCLSVRTLPG